MMPPIADSQTYLFIKTVRGPTNRFITDSPQAVSEQNHFGFAAKTTRVSVAIFSNF